MSIWINDKLVIRWQDSDNRVFSQRKRLPNTTLPIIKEIQKHYLKSFITAVEFVKEHFNFSLRTSADIVKALRGEDVMSEYRLGVLLNFLKDTKESK